LIIEYFVVVAGGKIFNAQQSMFNTQRKDPRLPIFDAHLKIAGKAVRR
jgi:hypothetical protein